MAGELSTCEDKIKSNVGHALIMDGFLPLTLIIMYVPQANNYEWLQILVWMQSFVTIYIYSRSNWMNFISS